MLRRILPFANGVPEHGRLLGGDLAHRAFRIVGAAPVGSLAATPGVSLGIEIVEVSIVARRPEGGAAILDGALDAALLIAARNRHRPRLEVVMGGKVEQGRVEADRRALSLEHG